MRARFETFHLGAQQCCAPNSICTFFTNKLEQRDPATIAAMKLTSPVLTRRTTLWNGWIGFNASSQPIMAL